MIDSFLKSISPYICTGDLTPDDNINQVRSEFLKSMLNIISIKTDKTEHGFDAIVRTIGYDVLIASVDKACKNEINKNTVDTIDTAIKIISDISGYDDSLYISNLLKIG